MSLDGIDKVRTTPYKPSTNGMVERFHRTLNSILAKSVSANQRDWCERAPLAAAAYRASIHESTGYSPYLVMFGRENRMPIDILWESPSDEEEDLISVDEYVEQQRTVMQSVCSQVRARLGVTAQRRKDYYDIKVKPEKFHVGMWVWYFYPRRRVGLSPKWQKFYTGPYLVTHVIEPNNVVLQKSKRAAPFVVHKDKLKLFHGNAPLSWLKVSADEQPPQEDGTDGAISVATQTDHVELQVHLVEQRSDTALVAPDDLVGQAVANEVAPNSALITNCEISESGNSGN